MGQHLKLTLKQSLSHVYDLSFSYISAIFLPFFFFPHLAKLLRLFWHRCCEKNVLKSI